MKKISLVVTILFAAGMCSNAYCQTNNGQIPNDKFEANTTQKKFLQNELINTYFLLTSSLFHQQSITWKWDTILSYNDSDIPLQRISQSFDGNGFITSQLTEKFQNGSWVNYIKGNYTCDNQGYIQEVVTNLWQTTSWVNNLRLTISYNFSGKIILESVEKKEGENWVNSFRRSYTYDANFNKIGMLQENFKNGVWVNKLRTTFAYDLNGNLLSAFTEYSDSGGPWEFGARFTYTNDSNGYWLELLIESFETGTWEKAARCAYSNDSKGNILTELYQNWENGNWVNDAKKSYAYDVFSNSTSGQNEIWQNGGWHKDMQSSYLLNRKEIIYVFNDQLYRFEAKYSPLTSDITNFSDNSLQLKVFPNPAIDFISITNNPSNSEIIYLKIYNSIGDLVKSTKITQNISKIYIGDLVNGIYIIKATSKNRALVQKLVIKK